MSGQTIGAILMLAFVIIYHVAIPIYSAIKDFYLFPLILAVVTGAILGFVLRSLTKINRHPGPPGRPSSPNKEDQAQEQVSKAQEHPAVKLLRALTDR